MRRAEEAGTDDCPVKIKLVAPPLYVLTTQTLDKVCFMCRKQSILGLYAAIFCPIWFSPYFSSHCASVVKFKPVDLKGI